MVIEKGSTITDRLSQQGIDLMTSARVYHLVKGIELTIEL
jgi:hypothetical protein